MNVTLVSSIDGFGLLTTTVEVVPGVTICVIAPLVLLEKLPSPR